MKRGDSKETVCPDGEHRGKHGSTYASPCHLHLSLDQTLMTDVFGSKHSIDGSSFFFQKSTTAVRYAISSVTLDMVTRLYCTQPYRTARCVPVQYRKTPAT